MHERYERAVVRTADLDALAGLNAVAVEDNAVLAEFGLDDSHLSAHQSRRLLDERGQRLEELRPARAVDHAMVERHGQL